MNPLLFKAYKLPIMLLGGNLLLAVILLAEWQFHSGSRDRLAAILQQNRHSAAKFASLPVYKTMLGVEDDYHNIVDQPLFIEGRQPVENSGEAQRNLGQNPITPVAKPSIRLTGVVMIPDALVALLQDNMGKNFRVKQGETIQGWDVDSIENDKITLSNGEDHQIVLLREPKPAKRSPDASAPPASPRPEMREGEAAPPEIEEPEPEPDSDIEASELESEDP